MVKSKMIYIRGIHNAAGIVLMGTSTFFQLFIVVATIMKFYTHIHFSEKAYAKRI